MWVKKGVNWGSLLETARREHWRKLLVTLRFRDRLHAGKPASLDGAKAMLKARGLEDQIEPLPLGDAERAVVAEEVVQEGLCEFTRRAGKSGIWFPSHHIKAGLKENLSVLKITQEKRGTKGEMAEGIFVYGVVPEGAESIERDWVYLGEGPDGQDTSVTHSMTARGPITAIKRNEYVLRREISFEVALSLRAVQKISPEDFVAVMVHFAEHGLGANRSQGIGKFDLVSIVDV